MAAMTSENRFGPVFNKGREEEPVSILLLLSRLRENNNVLTLDTLVCIFIYLEI